MRISLQNDTTRRLVVHTLFYVALVIIPLGSGLFALVWWEICRAMFIAGMFLSPLAIVPGWLFSKYCLPVTLLFPNLDFSHVPFGGLIGANPWPADTTAYLSVVLFYSAISVVIGACISALLTRWVTRNKHANKK
jgi:hypothetical protein